jgi:alpha-galactosidase
MSSFSDAHEIPEIPIIAANLHRLILPRQSQIWAVLHQSDTPQRLIFSLAATFLGRMCLSGEVEQLEPAQWQSVQQAMALYQKAAPIIKHGHSKVFGETGASWRHPTGWQAVRRISDDGKSILLVVHTFASAPATIDVPWPEGSWQLAGGLSESSENAPAFSPSHITVFPAGDFDGSVFLFQCK